MDGRNYVTYTVTFSAAQAKEFLSSELKQVENPNYRLASRFYLYRLDEWRKVMDSEYIDMSKYTSMSKEEIQEALNIFETTLSAVGYGEDTDEPLFTVDGLDVMLSFVMNKDGTFTTNMYESYADITLNCMNNLKARICTRQSDDADTILGRIYKSFTPSAY
jgi:hypothetical protein